MRLQDLPPRHDPKGGSPRTPPGGIRVGDLAQYPPDTPLPTVIHHANGTIWKVWVSILATALVGITVAYFTALRSQGVSRNELEEYVNKFSPYSHDKEVIALQQQSQDKAIGSLDGLKDRIFDRLNKVEIKDSEQDRDIADHDKKIKTLADYLEEEKKVKR